MNKEFDPTEVEVHTVLYSHVRGWDVNTTIQDTGWRVRQTTCALCIATARSLIAVQNQLQLLHSVHNEFEKIISHSVKHPKWLLGCCRGGGVGLGENSYEKVSRARRHSKGLFTHAIFGKKSSQLSIYLKTSSLKIMRLWRFLYWIIHPYLTAEEKIFFHSYSKHNYTARKYGFGHFLSHFNILKKKKSLKHPNYQKIWLHMLCIILYCRSINHRSFLCLKIGHVS